MSQALKERLKNICIFMLIVAGVLQVGILWGYQNQGTPIRFLLPFFSSTQTISDAVTRESLFVPDRIILCDGYQSHCLITRESELYKGLWDEARNGLTNIADDKIELNPTSEKWGDISEKRGFIIDFGYVMNTDLLKWFLGTSGKTQNMPSIRKIMVKPDLVDENTSVFYLYGTNGKCYVSDPIPFERSKSIEDILTAVENDRSQKYRIYSSFRGAKVDDTMKSEPDVLFIISSNRIKYWPYYEYNCKLPSWASNKEEQRNVLLGNEKDRYDPYTDKKSNTNQYVYGSNIYRYYANGFLTYQYYLDSNSSSGNSNIGEALLNAYGFINRINKQSNSAADIVLTSVDERQKGIFTFCFDYSLTGMPVEVDFAEKDAEAGKIQHAITIQANEKRVVKCDWLIRSFEKGPRNSYNESFEELGGNAGMVYVNIHIRDMRTGYFIQSAQEAVLKPELLIEMRNLSKTRLELPIKKGD